MTAKQHLNALEIQFRARPKIPAADLSGATGEIDSLGGVYGIWKDGKLVYFGETSHLSHRIDEMVNLGRHHSVALVLGAQAIGLSGRARAKLFRDLAYCVSWMTVDIGRAEFEDYVVARRDADLLNKVQKRFTLRSDYSEWIAPE